MKAGVRESGCFVLFLTQDVFKRPFVLMEIAEAIKAGKPILLIHEEGESAVHRAL